MFDGIELAQYFTKGFDLNPNSNGKVLIHEVGHYLGLFHTFQGGCSGLNGVTCASEGDMICDTPPTSSFNSDCGASLPISGSTCNENYFGLFPCSSIAGGDERDLIESHMDYNPESCNSMFTDGQVNRMHAVIQTNRMELVSPSNLLFTGIYNCQPSNNTSSTY